MSDKKTIKNLRIPFWAIPLRAVFRIVKKFLPNNSLLKQVNLDGIKYLVWANEDIGKKLILLRSFEKNETDAFKSLIKLGDVCLDVGGNVGYFTLNFARQVGPAGKVFVFEPIRRNALMIQLGAEINSFGGNVQVMRAAVSNKVGNVSLTIPSVDGAYAYISQDEGDTVSEINETVDCIRLDDFVAERELSGVDIVKIDVEGAELLVLEGATTLFSGGTHQPRVVMIELVDEFLNRYEASITKVMDLMGQYGYKPYYAISKGALVEFQESDYNKVFNVFFILEVKVPGISSL